MEYITIKTNLQQELNLVSLLLDQITNEKHDLVFEIESEDLHALCDKEIKRKTKAFFEVFKSPVIYYFKVVGCDDCSILNHAFSRAKTHDKSRKYSKLNGITAENNVILYVGSSQNKNLVTRINNHLGVGSKSMYSMHMKAWLPKDSQYKIQIYAYKPVIPEHKLAIFNILEVIEQGFWNYYRPLFGKRSGLL